MHGTPPYMSRHAIPWAAEHVNPSAIAPRGAANFWRISFVTGKHTVPPLHLLNWSESRSKIIWVLAKF